MKCKGRIGKGILWCVVDRNESSRALFDSLPVWHTSLCFHWSNSHGIKCNSKMHYSCPGVPRFHSVGFSKDWIRCLWAAIIGNDTTYRTGVSSVFIVVNVLQLLTVWYKDYVEDGREIRANRLTGKTTKRMHICMHAIDIVSTTERALCFNAFIL